MLLLKFVVLMLHLNRATVADLFIGSTNKLVACFHSMWFNIAKIWPPKVSARLSILFLATNQLAMPTVPWVLKIAII
jgi:hypothetical protein